MKLTLVLTSANPETVFNAFRLAAFAQAAGDAVTVFLMGAAVDIASARTEPFDAASRAAAFLHDGGEVLACGTCLDLRGLGESPLYTRSDLKALHDLVRTSDRVLTF